MSLTMRVGHSKSRRLSIISRAVGTRFSVRLREGDVVETVVADGRVLVLRDSSVLSGRLDPTPIGRTLSKGERLIADARSARVTRIGMAAVERQLQWTLESDVQRRAPRRRHPGLEPLYHPAAGHPRPRASAIRRSAERSTRTTPMPTPRTSPSFSARSVSVPQHPDFPSSSV